MTGERELKELISLVVERAVREADITGGDKVVWGSQRHLDDLDKRIADATFWRDRAPRGSEARGNYSRVLARLKADQASARRHAARAIATRASNNDD